MTIATTNTSSGPYTGTGAVDQEFEVTFQSGGPDRIRVWLDFVEVDAADWIFNREDDGTGTLVATLDGSVYITSAPLFTQETDFQRYGPYFPDDLNAPLDQAAVRDQYLNNLLAGVVPDGADVPGSGAGQFFARDAGGNPVFASGTGADAGLRTDLAAGGAALVGLAAGGTVEDALIPSPLNFGVIGDGIADDTEAFQAWVDYCGDNDFAIATCLVLTVNITDTITLPAAGALLPFVTFKYTGTRDRTAIYVAGSPRPFAAFYRFFRIYSPTIDWSSANFIGLQINDAYGCQIFVGDIEGFNTGYECRSTNAGFAYNKLHIGTLRDNKYNEVLRTAGNGSTDFVNENKFYGGNYGATSLSDSLGSAYGTFITWDKVDSYRGANNNHWYSPCYEMGAPSGATRRTPIYIDGTGAYNYWHGIRAEGNKGPIAIIDGGGDSAEVHHNVIDIGFASGASQVQAILQVNGAAANLLTGAGCAEYHWSSGDLRPLLSSYGGADTTYMRGPVFLFDGAVNVPTRSTAVATQARTNRNALQLFGAGVFVAVDTTRIKTFRVAMVGLAGFQGRLFVGCLDAAGSRLTGNATDATWGNEQYAKAGANLLGLENDNWGGGYAPGGDGAFLSDLITLREEVKTVYIGFTAGTKMLAIQSFSVTGYATPETTADAAGAGAMRAYVPLDDPGHVALATAKPDTAGTHGYYPHGADIKNANAAATVAQGWQCSVAGWLAPVWTISTAYPVLGAIVTNDTGKMYELITAGTSAGSGGPTGTNADITDGTCHWKYIGVKAAFVTLAVTS